PPAAAAQLSPARDEHEQGGRAEGEGRMGGRRGVFPSSALGTRQSEAGRLAEGERVPDGPGSSWADRASPALHGLFPSASEREPGGQPLPSGRRLPRGPGRSRAMKILFVSNLYPPNTIGGYERLCFEVAAAFVEADHEVAVLTSGNDRGLQG